jgi:hypothetical protein
MILDNYNTKKIIVNQFIGLGDILFCIPIFKNLNKLGYDIIWPVNENFLNIQKNFNFIKFISKEKLNIDYDNDKIFFYEDNLVLPLRFCNNILNNGNQLTCMSDKYKYFDFNIDMWKTLTWDRDYEKENILYYDILGLKDNENFNLINKEFNMDKKINIDVKNNFKNIDFKIIDGFNILDWYKVIENSTNIHTVGTAIIFLIEVIPTLKLKDYVLYPRIPFEYNCNYYNYLLKKVTKENL